MGSEELLTVEQVAEYLKISTATLAFWRREGRELPYVKVGFQVRYRRSDLETWLASRTHGA